MRLQDKVALVIGVGKGVGAAVSLLFAQEGADVILVARKGETIDAVAERIAKLGRRAIPIEADATQPEEIGRVVATAMDAFGKIDVFASLPGGGFTHVNDLADTEFESFQTVFNNHLVSLFHGTAAVIPHMKTAQNGSIITISASYTVRRDGNIAYGTFKEGIIGFSKNLARELQPYDIRVNCLCPGFVWLPLQSGKIEVPQKSLNRRGQPEDIAYAVLYLASDESRWVTGQTIVIDGGVDVLVERERELD
jgi:NAD(P)-dependent dehydrogenase (short-subunit alcohol dehydrogenase family)